MTLTTVMYEFRLILMCSTRERGREEGDEEMAPHRDGAPRAISRLREIAGNPAG